MSKSEVATLRARPSFDRPAGGVDVGVRDRQSEGTR